MPIEFDNQKFGNTLAFSLLKQDDDNQKVIATDKGVIVAPKNKFQFYSYESLAKVVVGERKFMFPIIVGGIIGCFSVIMITDPVYSLSAFIVCVLAFYYGWKGKKVITFFDGGIERDFTFDVDEQRLNGFARFINQYVYALKSGNEDRHIVYHTLVAEDWDQLHDDHNYTCNSLETEGFIHASTVEQLPRSIQKHFNGVENLMVLTIDYRKLQQPFVFEPSPSGEYFPHIYGKINLDAIISKELR